jgi:TonB-dependent receptor
MTRDHVSAAALDLARAIDDSFFKSFDFGGRISERQKSHHQYDYTILFPGGATSFFPYGTPSGTLSASDLKEFTLSGFASVPNMLWVNWDKAVPIVFGSMANTLPAGLGGTAGNHYLQVASWNLNRQGANAAHGFDNQIQHWQVQETTVEGYAKVEFAHDFGSIPMAGAFGVRVDDISTVSTGVQTTDGSTFTPVRVTNHYIDVLPSLNLNFHVADDQVVRFGAAMAQSRPPLDTLNTGYSLNTSATGVPASNVGGNPKLKPFKADQVDLSYEWYFHPESLFSVAAYYKHIMNYIGSGISQQIINGTTYAITSPMNGPGGNLEGVEFSFQSRLYFLPGALSDFGIYANASFVTSDIKEFHPMLNPYSMGGLAKNSDEFDLFYDQGGFEARIATKYHSSFTMIPGWASGQLDTLDPEITVDATASYQWNEHIGIRVQGLNLTNQVTRFSGGRQAGDALRGSNDPNDLAAYSVFGRTFMFDISYKD